MLINYLPSFIANVDEFKALNGGLDDEVFKLNKNTDDILNNFFIHTSNKDGIFLFEQMLKINTNLDETIKNRRANILSIYNEMLPYTIKNLPSMIDAICGIGMHTLILDTNMFTLKILLDKKAKSLKRILYQFLERVVPINIFIHIEIDYNSWLDVSKVTYKMLTPYKWGNVRELEVKNGQIKK